MLLDVKKILLLWNVYRLTTMLLTLESFLFEENGPSLKGLGTNLGRASTRREHDCGIKIKENLNTKDQTF